MTSARSVVHSGWNLPLSLLDLTLAQARQQPFASTVSKTANRSRANVLLERRTHSHALVVKTKPPPDLRGGYLKPSTSAENGGYGQIDSEIVRGGRERRRWPTSVAKGVRHPALKQPTTQAAMILHERVDALVKRSTTELSTREIQEDEAESASLHYNDSDLLKMYADLLAHPKAEPKIRTKPDASAERQKLLQVVANRLIVPSEPSPSTSTFEPSSSLASRLSARRQTSSVPEDGRAMESDPLDMLQSQLDPQILHHGILLRLIDVVLSMEDARKIVGSSSTPVVVLSSGEWNALLHACIDRNEVDIAESTLLLMKRCGSAPLEELVNDLMAIHASRGDVPAVLSFFEKLAINKPTERQRDLHIKAHLKSPSPDYGIQSALQALHNYEGLALIPPVQSYTRLICALFSARSAQLEAHAWDLFSHMRYVAHAKPDPMLYALMIRACAGTGFSQSGYVSDPARALDLWTEMTTDVGYEPTVGAYNAVILACARSSEYAADAFRLAREMLDGHRDAYGDPLMHATQETFNALLIAAKMRKDLPRARWILAEMLKIHDQNLREGRDSGVAPDAQTVVHVFHAYASYRPPFRRSETRIIDESELEAVARVDVDKLEAPQREIEEVPTSKAPFSVTPPQTHQDVLAEANALFERILEETGSDLSAGERSDSKRGPFSQVSLSASALNSYLSIHYMHGSLEESRILYDEVFRRTGIERSARTYIEALERCARAEKPDRELARSFADDVWAGWLETEKTLVPRSTDARLIERAHAAMIRMCSLIGDLDRAMYLVRDFETRYTPRDVAMPSQLKSVNRSTRTSLFAARPIVRLTTSSEIPDDTVPPLLTLRDLELLHHRLVVAGPKRRADIDYLTYLGKTYMHSLRRRRDLMIRA